MTEAYTPNTPFGPFAVFTMSPATAHWMYSKYPDSLHAHHNAGASKAKEALSRQGHTVLAPHFFLSPGNTVSTQFPESVKAEQHAGHIPIWRDYVAVNTYYLWSQQELARDARHVNLDGCPTTEPSILNIYEAVKTASAAYVSQGFPPLSDKAVVSSCLFRAAYMKHTGASPPTTREPQASDHAAISRLAIDRALFQATVHFFPERYSPSDVRRANEWAARIVQVQTEVDLHLKIADEQAAIPADQITGWDEPDSTAPANGWDSPTLATPSRTWADDNTGGEDVDMDMASDEEDVDVQIEEGMPPSFAQTTTEGPFAGEYLDMAAGVHRTARVNRPSARLNPLTIPPARQNDLSRPTAPAPPPPLPSPVAPPRLHASLPQRPAFILNSLPSSASLPSFHRLRESGRAAPAASPLPSSPLVRASIPFASAPSPLPDRAIQPSSSPLMRFADGSQVHLPGMLQAGHGGVLFGQGRHARNLQELRSGRIATWTSQYSNTIDVNQGQHAPWKEEKDFALNHPNITQEELENDRDALYARIETMMAQAMEEASRQGQE